MGAVFALYSAWYFWIPKILGLEYSRSWGKVHFWVLFVGVNLTFFPQHFLGLQGMPRRISDYPDAFAGWNLISSYGSLVSVVATWIFLDILYLQLTAGKESSRYPWLTPQFYTDTLRALLERAFESLEWGLNSPPMPHAFVSLPLQSEFWALVSSLNDCLLYIGDGFDNACWTGWEFACNASSYLSQGAELTNPENSKSLGQSLTNNLPSGDKMTCPPGLLDQCGENLKNALTTDKCKSLGKHLLIYSVMSSAGSLLAVAPNILAWYVTSIGPDIARIDLIGHVPGLLEIPVVGNPLDMRGWVGLVYERTADALVWGGIGLGFDIPNIASWYWAIQAWGNPFGTSMMGIVGFGPDNSIRVEYTTSDSIRAAFATCAVLKLIYHTI